MIFCSISSGSVLAAVMNSLALANPDPLTYARRVVLADYIIDEVNYDASTLPNIVQFIDESVSLRGSCFAFLIYKSGRSVSVAYFLYYGLYGRLFLCRVACKRIQSKARKWGCAYGNNQPSERLRSFDGHFSRGN